MSNILDENGHAISECDVNVFNFHPETREYIGLTSDHLLPGFGIAADSTLDALPAEIPDGSVPVRSADNKSWSIVEDHRGQIAYFKSSRAAVVINSLGTINSDLTQQKPDSEYSVWDETTNSWLIDENALNAFTVEVNKQRKVNLINQATQIINVINYAVNGGYATETDNANLATLQRYAYDISKLDESNVNTEWPDMPELQQEPTVTPIALEVYSPVEFLVEEYPEALPVTESAPEATVEEEESSDKD